jgi:hypothetical protein
MCNKILVLFVHCLVGVSESSPRATQERDGHHTAFSASTHRVKLFTHVIHQTREPPAHQVIHNVVHNESFAHYVH